MNKENSLTVAPQTLPSRPEMNSTILPGFQNPRGRLSSWMTTTEMHKQGKGLRLACLWGSPNSRRYSSRNLVQKSIQLLHSVTKLSCYTHWRCTVIVWPLLPARVMILDWLLSKKNRHCLRCLTSKTAQYVSLLPLCLTTLLAPLPVHEEQQHSKPGIAWWLMLWLNLETDDHFMVNRGRMLGIKVLLSLTCMEHCHASYHWTLLCTLSLSLSYCYHACALHHSLREGH